MPELFVACSLSLPAQDAKFHASVAILDRVGEDTMVLLAIPIHYPSRCTFGY